MASEFGKARRARSSSGLKTAAVVPDSAPLWAKVLNHRFHCVLYFQTHLKSVSTSSFLGRSACFTRVMLLGGPRTSPSTSGTRRDERPRDRQACLLSGRYALGAVRGW